MKVLSIIAALLAIFVQFESAQGQEITKAEYIDLATRGFDMMESGPYRVTRTNIGKGGAEEGEVISEITEYQTMERWRRVGVLKTVAGTKQEEHIHINDRDFKRSGKGKWKEHKGDGAFSTTGGGGTGGAAVRDIKQTEKFHRLTAESINGQEVQVIESLKNVFEGEGTSASTSEYYQRLWIAKNGRILKAESRSTHDGIVTDHTMSEYEYNGNIRVSVPRK